MGNCVSLCVSFRQMAGLERVFGCAGRVLSPVTRSKAAEHVRRGLRASAKSSVLGGLSQTNRVMTSKPTVSNRVIRCSVSVTSPSAIWRVTSRAGFSFPRATSGRLVVVGVRIALRPHHLPLPGDEVVDRDGDLTALLLRGEPHLDMPSVLAE